MTLSRSCPQGHTWPFEPLADGATQACPTCGAAALAPEDKTVAPRPDPFRTLPPTPADPRDAATVAPSDASPSERRGLAPPSVPGYELLAELGRGGMGVVYQARHLKLNRVVALKMILAGSHAGAADLARFQTEAEAIARLQHPNIVQVYEVGEHEGKPFFSLEFCAGGSLAQKLKGTPLPAREAAALLETLARAMQAAHDQHIIHRDLKPANVLLRRNSEIRNPKSETNAKSKAESSKRQSGPVSNIGNLDLGFVSDFGFRISDFEPKITDFGLAKKLDEAGQTHSGAIMGTPSYMAPEQAAGKSGAIGPAADVYALGAILYECLTGRPPFKAATALDTIMQVVSEEPVPVRQLNMQVPRDLETVCVKCLQKEPGKRYASAHAMAEDLRRFSAGEPIVARPVSAAERAVKWAKRKPAQAAVLAVSTIAVLVLVGGGLAFTHQLDKRAGELAIALNKAEDEGAKAKKARDFLVSMFQVSEIDNEAGDITARRILERAEKRIPGEFADQPGLQVALLAGISNVRDLESQTTPYAMILEVRGTVQLQSTQMPNQQPVPQTLLYSKDRLSLAANAHVQLVILSDLHQERLKSATEATVRWKGCEPADAVTERTQDILMTFVRLPKGTFYMGWENLPGQKFEKTEIKEDFEIAVHDVTQGQWQAVMGANPSGFSPRGVAKDKVLDISDAELKLFPVESVSWDDVQEFIKKLNEKERGRGYLYRLPTEAEWEYACRGGATSEEECSYHFYFDKPTNDLSSEQANFNGNEPFGKAPKGKSLQRTTRVGAYPPNKLGLCDMHGNVFQWTSTLVQASTRVCRGGDWSSHAMYCCAARSHWPPRDFRYNGFGFRLARVAVR